MIDRRTIADPTSRYGDGRAGTRRFMTQRVTGALNIFFTGFLVWLVISLVRASPDEAVALVRNPAVAVLLILLVINAPIHMHIGMHEVITDYLTEERTNRLGNLANSAYGVVIAVVGVASVVKILFWG